MSDQMLQQMMAQLMAQQNRSPQQAPGPAAPNMWNQPGAPNLQNTAQGINTLGSIASYVNNPTGTAAGTDQLAKSMANIGTMLGKA